MPMNQRESTKASLILLAAGISCLLLSWIALAQRQAVAASLLGAHFLFGIPLSSADSLKVSFVGLGGLAGLVTSLILIVAGAVVLTRGSRPGIASDVMATPR